jgi:fused signal recognition particle receptor
MRREHRRAAKQSAAETLAQTALGLLAKVEAPLSLAGGHRPFVILVLGVNGTGKTTTVGKLAHRLKATGHSVLLAAADTFRAAAVEHSRMGPARERAGDRAGAGCGSAAVVHSLVAGRARSPTS